MLTITDYNSTRLKQLLKNETAITIDIKKEDSHTDILEVLFNDEDVFASFLQSIGEPLNVTNVWIKKQYPFWDFRNIKRRFIDLLVSYSVGADKHVIIIENKINGAVDQKNQLKSYYEHVRDHFSAQVIKIVYLAAERTKSPTLESLSHETLEHFYNYQTGCNPIMVFYDTTRSPNIKSLYHDCFQDALTKKKTKNSASELKNQPCTVLLWKYMEYLKSNFNKNKFTTEIEALKHINNLHDWLAGNTNSLEYYDTSTAFALDSEGKVFDKNGARLKAYYDYKIAKYVVAIDIWVDWWPVSTVFMDLHIRPIKNKSLNTQKDMERKQIIFNRIGALHKPYTHNAQEDKYRYKYIVPSDVGSFKDDLNKIRSALSQLSEEKKDKWA